MKSKSGFIDPANIKTLLDMAGQTIQLCQITETQGDSMLGIPGSTTEVCRSISGWIQPLNDHLVAAIAGINNESINRTTDGRLKGYLLASDIIDYQWQPDVFLRFDGEDYWILSRQEILQKIDNLASTPLLIEVTLAKKAD